MQKSINEYNYYMKENEILKDFLDESIQSVYSNTQNFTMYFLQKCLRKEKNVFTITLENSPKHININDNGIIIKDILIPLDNFYDDRFISYNYLKNILGENFNIIFNDNKHQILDCKDPNKIIGEVYLFPEFIINSNLEIIKSKYEELKTFEEDTLTLKRIK